MEIYFNPVQIEYVRDLIKQAMGRSNAAAHSFYSIKSASEAIGYSDYDNDFAVIEQALEQLSTLYRKHYDFINITTHQYAKAENQNIDFLDEILFEFSPLHEDIGSLDIGQFHTTALEPIDPIDFEEKLETSLLPIDVREFLPILKPDLKLSAESDIKSEPIDAFIKLNASYFNEDMLHTPPFGSAAMSPAEIDTVLLPPKDSVGFELPIRVIPIQLAGFFVPGILVGITMRDVKVFGLLDTPDNTKKIGQVQQHSPVNPSSATKKVARLAQEIIFKTIEDFFIYLTRIEYQFDEAGIQVPPVTYLQKLSISIPVYTFDTPALVNRLVGSYEKLESILFFRKKVRIKKVPVAEMQECNHILPLKFTTGGYDSLYAPLQNLDSHQDNISVSTDTVLPLDNILYTLDAQQENVEELQDVIIGSYQTVSQFVHDNFDEELVLPTVKTGQYFDVDEIDQRVIAPIIFPGIRVTNEMAISSLEAVNNEIPVIRNTEYLMEKTLDAITVIDDEGSRNQIPMVNIMGYRSLTGFGGYSQGRWGSNYNSISNVSSTTNEAPKIPVAQIGSFTSTNPLTDEQSDVKDIIQSRGTAPYMDIDQLNLIKEQIFIKDVVVTDYISIDATNKLKEIAHVLQSGGIKEYIGKYENGPTGLAVNITQTLVKSDASMEATETYVQDIAETIASRIKEDFKEIEKHQVSRLHEQNSGGALQTNIEYQTHNDVHVHEYPPSIPQKDTTKDENITTNVYGDGIKTQAYKASETVDTNIEGIALYKYKTDMVDDTVKLQTYELDDVPSSTIRNVEEALITDITQHTEADIQISITKRLELWLKWLFEMSMKNLKGGKDTAEFVATIRHLKKMSIDDEPIFSDITGKSIKRFIDSIDKEISENQETGENIF